MQAGRQVQPFLPCPAHFHCTYLPRFLSSRPAACPRWNDVRRRLPTDAPGIGPHHISSAVCLQSLHRTGMHDRNTLWHSSFSACDTCRRSSAKLDLAVRGKAMASLNRRTPEIHAGRGAHQCLQGIHRSQFVLGREQQEDSAWVLAPLWACEYVPKIDVRHQRPVQRAGLAVTVCRPQHGKTRHLSPLAALKRRHPFGLCSSFGSMRARGHCPDHASPTDVQLGGFCNSPCFALPRRPIDRAVSKAAAARWCMARP